MVWHPYTSRQQLRDALHELHDGRGLPAEVRPARLGLARISVVRGEGPAAGTAAIDDYVRTLEPVTDYLTKYSGLVRAVTWLQIHRKLLFCAPN